MRIGLIDVDGHHFPNLAIMKLSAWHKANGDEVEWYSPLFEYDRVYMSKVFTFTPDYQFAVRADEIVRGGTGYGIMDELPTEIENAFPDYSIYQSCNYSIGFLTRGCIRNCPWCIVPKKEGRIRPANEWRNIKRKDKRDLILMDNNILASDWGIGQLESMIGHDVRIDINQAMDARLMTKEIADIISRLKWMKYIRFACDTSAMLPEIRRAANLLNGAGVKPYRLFVYALIQDTEEALKRIEELDSIGVQVFAQPYRDFKGGEPTEDQKRLARWCNMKAVHRVTRYQDYSEAKRKEYKKRKCE